MPEHFKLIGFVAATLTTVSFIPQVLKIWRSRHAKDISLPTFAIFSTGVLLWLIYGLLIGDWPLILSNAVTFALATSVVVLAIRFRSCPPGK